MRTSTKPPRVAMGTQSRSVTHAHARSPAQYPSLPRESHTVPRRVKNKKESLRSPDAPPQEDSCIVPEFNPFPDDSSTLSESSGLSLHDSSTPSESSTSSLLRPFDDSSTLSEFTALPPSASPQHVCFSLRLPRPFDDSSTLSESSIS